MKKYISCVLLTAMLVMTSACGGTDTSSETDSEISISRLQDTMLSADTTLPEMTRVSSEDDQAELNFTALTDLSYDMADAYFYAYATEGTAEEIAVIKLKDKNDAAAMMDSLHEHIEKRKGTFQEYAPEQISMAENAVVTREGSYVALIISSKNGMVQKAFQACFE